MFRRRVRGGAEAGAGAASFRGLAGFSAFSAFSALSAFFFSGLGFSAMFVNLCLALADEDVAAARAGHGAPDHQQVLAGVHADHLEVAGGDAIRAHVAGGAHALDDAGGEGRGADAARGPVEHRAVGGRAAAEVVALHHALEALALAHAHHVHRVPGGEDLHRDLVAHLDLGALPHPHLAEHAAGGQAGLVEVALHGLGDPLDLAPAHQAELHGRVAVLVLRLALHDHAGPRLDHGHGHRPAVLGVDLGHADLLPDDSLD